MYRKAFYYAPYRNNYSGPEFPVGKGSFLSLPFSQFLKLCENPKYHEYLWFSTSENYLFMSVKEFSAQLKEISIQKIINEYRYYNCNNETGNAIHYWFDFGRYLTPWNCYQDKKIINEFKNSNMRYTTFIKRYCKWYTE